VEEIIRSFGEVAEYEVELSSQGALTELNVRVEPAAEAGAASDLAGRIERAFLNALALRVPVALAQPGALPRFELKAKRWVKK
jgi:phenylacetate-CoA ligase